MVESHSSRLLPGLVTTGAVRAVVLPLLWFTFQFLLLVGAILALMLSVALCTGGSLTLAHLVLPQTPKPHLSSLLQMHQTLAPRASKPELSKRVLGWAPLAMAPE